MRVLFFKSKDESEMSTTHVQQLSSDVTFVKTTGQALYRGWSRVSVKKFVWFNVI